MRKSYPYYTDFVNTQKLDHRVLCNKKQAQELLDSAIGDKRISKKLFNFDNEHQKFIIFEDEKTLNNTYHGYHVDNEDEVPHDIRKLLMSQGTH